MSINSYVKFYISGDGETTVFKIALNRIGVSPVSVLQINGVSGATGEIDEGNLILTFETAPSVGGVNPEVVFGY